MSGQPSQYKENLGDSLWHIKLNAGLDALWDADVAFTSTIADLSSLINNWAIEDQIVTMIPVAHTYVDSNTFKVTGDYTSRFPAGAVVQVQLAAGMVFSTVDTSSYSAPDTTVNLVDAILGASDTMVRVYVVATRDGLWPNGPGYVVARDYGSDRAALEAVDAVAAAAGKELLITATFPIDDDVTLAAPKVSVQPGVPFAISTTKTLTINGNLNAGPYQIFSCTGTGKVVFGTGSVEAVYPEWWGVSSSAMLAFQAAVNTGLRVMVSGAYTLDNSASALMLNDTTNNFASIEGAHGWSASTLQFTSDAHPGIQIGYAGGLPNITIKNLGIYGPGGTTAGNFGIYFPNGASDISQLTISNVLVRLWGEDGIRVDGPAGPITISDAYIYDCKYGIKIGTPQDVTIHRGAIQNCLGGISVDASAFGRSVGSVSVYDTDIELAAAEYPALYLNKSFGNVFHGLTLAITPASLTTGVALVHLDSNDCIGNTFINLLTNAAGGLSNFFVQGEGNTIIGGYHYGKLDGTGAGYFVRDHGTKTTVINPYVNASTYAAGKDIVYADLATRTGVYIGVKMDASGRPGVMGVEGHINNGMSQLLANNEVGGEADWLMNAYYSSGWKYLLADEASKIEQINGIISFSTAAAGVAGAAITWIDRLIINNAGKFTLPGGLTTYADNTAALAGGLTAGDLYKTAAGVVMITYTP